MNRLPREEACPDFADDLVGRIDDAERLAAVRATHSPAVAPGAQGVALCVRPGLDYAAAAKALDIPVGTVRSRLSRARKKLHKYAQASPVAGAGAAVEDGNPDPGPLASPAGPETPHAARADRSPVFNRGRCGQAGTAAGRRER
ncbi:sigma factor-like helix-turn-helix DNA-binding protein [Streptomyces sp. NPDC058740]|uniref:sigma factor-like helix-turn-helix DNA-binding protein n=1 Tax=Streptomyces sp. NPDC058740 TaxID=3346619 RepID=UPI0036960F4A